MDIAYKFIQEETQLMHPNKMLDNHINASNNHIV